MRQGIRMIVLRKKCLLLLVSINVSSLVIASEAPKIKPNVPKYDAMKSLREYLDGLKKDLAAEKDLGKIDNDHKNYAGGSVSGNSAEESVKNKDVKALNDQQRFGRGSSGNNAKL
jgi:hypothetical protein